MRLRKKLLLSILLVALVPYTLGLVVIRAVTKKASPEMFLQPLHPTVKTSPTHLVIFFHKRLATQGQWQVFPL